MTFVGPFSLSAQDTLPSLPYGESEKIKPYLKGILNTFLKKRSKRIGTIEKKQLPIRFKHFGQIKHTPTIVKFKQRGVDQRANRKRKTRKKRASKFFEWHYK